MNIYSSYYLARIIYIFGEINHTVVIAVILPLCFIYISDIVLNFFCCSKPVRVFPVSVENCLFNLIRYIRILKRNIRIVAYCSCSSNGIKVFFLRPFFRLQLMLSCPYQKQVLFCYTYSEGKVLLRMSHILNLPRAPDSLKENMYCLFPLQNS